MFSRPAAGVWPLHQRQGRGLCVKPTALGCSAAAVVVVVVVVVIVVAVVVVVIVAVMLLHSLCGKLTYTMLNWKIKMGKGQQQLKANNDHIAL